MDDGLDTQWTPAARQRYLDATGALVEEVRRHAEATAARNGRQAEVPAHIASASSLEVVLRVFAEAEFDWCGSFPLVLGPADDEDEEVPEEDDAPGSVLTLLGRWDHRVEDLPALLAAGRAAYLRAWPDDTEEDASLRVHDATSAAAEILHAGDLEDLRSAPGLRWERSTVGFVEHAGSTDEEFEDSPFALADEGPVNAGAEPG